MARAAHTSVRARCHRARSRPARRHAPNRPRPARATAGPRRSHRPSRAGRACADRRPAGKQMSPMLHAEDVTVRYGGLVALDHVSVQVTEGSITGLIGPNGAGKTTCFGVLSGLVRPRGGRVLMDGADVTRRSPQRRARAGMARTFQHQELFTSLTVREHLVLAHRARDRNVAGRMLLDCIGLGRRARTGEDAAVDSVLELVGLTHVAGARAATVPPGTGRLVELGRALATEPRVLLLDEPSSGLDA